MTPTEEKALAWLEANNFHDIKFSSNGPIDFTTSTGSFEVKKPHDKRIQFQEGQIEAIRAAQATILVFDDKGDKPIGIFSNPDDIKPFKALTYATRLTITITNPETADYIVSLSDTLGISQADIVVLAMKIGGNRLRQIADEPLTQTSKS